MAKVIPEIIAVDLFAGAGGTSTGILQAAEAMGIKIKLTAVNHWKTAVNSHALNHPNVTHICEDVETLHPRSVVPGGRLHLLAASTECTFHSNARGGGPCNEQSRSQPWQLIRWCTDLRVDSLICENVVEWVNWCRLLTEDTKIDGKWYKALRPDPRYKGEYFQRFVETLRRIGYTVEYKPQVSANFGDPTKRKRLILMARLNAPVIWPETTHADPSLTTLDGVEKLPWRTARDHVIDWSLEGKSIFNRKKPLSENTIRRIEAGLRKFGGPAAEPFLVMLRGLSESHIDKSATSVDGPIRAVTTGGTHIGLCEPMIIGQQSCAAAHPVTEPCPTVATAGAIAVVEPIILPQFSGSRPKSVNAPLGTVTTDGGPALVESCLINLKGQSNAADLNAPTPTITAHARHLGLIQPIIVPKQSKDKAVSTDAPLSAITTKSGHGLVEAILVQASHGQDPKKRGTTSRRTKSLNEPLPTITQASGLALAEPVLVPVNFGERKGQNTRIASLDAPLPTVVGSGTLGVAEPFITHCTHHGERPQHSVDSPVPAVTGAHRGEMALVQPMVMQTDQTGSNGCCIQSADAPLNTVVGRNNMAVVEPLVLVTDQTGPKKKAGVVRPIRNTAQTVDQPLKTVVSKQNMGLVQPMLCKFYGTGTAVSVDQPLDTVTTKDRFLLVHPVTGEVQAELDIRFRMLQPHELAAAHSFPKGYKFTGTKGDQTKQIGNSVSVLLAKAHALAMMGNLLALQKN